MLKKIRDFFGVTVDGAIGGLNKALRKLEGVHMYHLAKSVRHTARADAHTAKADLHAEEATRAVAVHSKISALIGQ